jgi:glycosyltransferase involved in cell wall biosynthesis
MVLLEGESGGWLVPFPNPISHEALPWLSASAQGLALSVLARAAQVTGEEGVIQAAHRAARSFTYDILDGGIAAPVGDGGVFFEDVSVYPAAHMLSGHIFALIGSFDYVAAVQRDEVSAHIQRGLDTLGRLLEEFDTGSWSRADLLSRRPASSAEHALQVTLLRALSQVSGNEAYARVAARWARYQRSLPSQVRRALSWRSAGLTGGKNVRAHYGAESRIRGAEPVCIPITAFPVVGGQRSVLAGVEQAMKGLWNIEYLTQHVGPDAEGLTIHAFGGRLSSPWQYPNVTLYARAGQRKLRLLLKQGRGIRVIVPQDGVFTGAFCALAGKATGVRVVCMDHGTVTLPFGPLYREERMKAAAQSSLLKRLLSRARFAFYWPTLRRMARITARYTDFFLVSGDDVEQTFLQLGVPPSRILRYPYMIDAERYHALEPERRIAERSRLGIGENDLVVTLAARLAPEKGLHIAIPGIAKALSDLPIETRAQIHILIAGDGPLRAQVEADIRVHGLENHCQMLGALGPDQVASLLGLSDIFLYTSTRGAGRPMAVLEAMAAGCAVIAARQPESLSTVLADNRGMAIPTNDSSAVASALTQLIGDRGRRQQMGRLAREHIQSHYSAEPIRRALLRATYWTPSFASAGQAISTSETERRFRGTARPGL